MTWSKYEYVFIRVTSTSGTSLPQELNILALKNLIVVRGKLFLRLFGFNDFFLQCRPQVADYGVYLKTTFLSDMFLHYINYLGGVKPMLTK